MHAFSRWMALVALLSGAAAHADKNDLKISLIEEPHKVRLDLCKTPDQPELCPTGDSHFQAFARAMSASLTSVNLMPPKTLGHAGFNLSAELSVVNLPKDPKDVIVPVDSGPQPATVLVPSVHIRKGLPFSVELGGRVGWVERSRMVAATGEVKWAINEGYAASSHRSSTNKGGNEAANGKEANSPTEKAAGEKSALDEEESGLEKFMRVLPDISLRGHATRLTGVRDLSLTSGGLDIGAGKQFTVGSMVTFTPYGGLDFTFVSAGSDVIDFRQDRSYNDSLQNNSLAALDDTDIYTQGKFSSNMTQRIYGGIRFIGGILQLGAELSFTRLGNVKLDPFPVDPKAPDRGTRGLPTVVTFNTSLGLDF